MKQFICFFFVFLFTTITLAQSGLPSPPSGGNSSVLLFPDVIDDIFDGNFTKVPDDQLFRLYLVSLYKGIYDNCNPSGDGIGLEAGYYGFPQVRQLIETGHAGTGNPFGALADYSQSRSIMDLANSVDSYPRFYEPGIEDGQAIAQTYKCNSLAVRGLKIKLSELFSYRKASLPERNDIERWQRLMHPSWRPILGKIIPATGNSSAALTEEAELYNIIKNHTNKESHNLSIYSRGLTTTFEVNQGDIIEMRASGYITVGAFVGSSSPSGIDGFTRYNRISGFKHGALLIRIGNSKWKSIKQDLIFKAENSGKIKFLVNDAEPKNNRGYYSVELNHYKF